jgi:hypothetical protein
MRTINRCPSCFTYVYSDARRCHGCGERLGRRKLLRRGSWVFIAFAVTAYAIGRSVELRQEQNGQARREVEQARRAETARAFLRAWVVGDDDQVAALTGRQESFKTELAGLRRLYPEFLPASSVLSVTFSEQIDQRHSQKGKARVAHEFASIEDDETASRRASFQPSRPLFKGLERHWSNKAFNFRAELTKDDAHYTLTGQICLGDTSVVCLTLQELSGVEGVIRMKQ